MKTPALNLPLPPLIRCSPQAVLKPQAGVPWADTMVLNPAIIQDPFSDRWHMLFRASGPWPQAQVPGKTLPYPIFLGYAWSDDAGLTWMADWTRPALAPALACHRERLWIKDGRGETTLNYANGCIEDPRLVWLDGRLLLSVACRVFPAGPYWEHRDLSQPPPQAYPDWTKSAHDLGRAVTDNLTVSVLYEVDLERLCANDYGRAFSYCTHLTEPERGDNRDAYLFPRRLKIDGRDQYVLIHRPRNPENYGYAGVPPNSMLVAAANSLYGFGTGECRHGLLARPEFEWERERIGGSWPPLPLDDGEWLMGYHGKRDDKQGYTQSFMILRENGNGGFPAVVHRCPERLLYARQPWELPSQRLFHCPCLFTCSGMVAGDDLVMAYGAADEQTGIARTDFTALIAYVRQFDADGKR